MQNSELFWFVS